MKVAILDGLTDVVDEPDGEALVVDRRERAAEHLLRLEQVMQVGAGVVGARVAVALLIERDEGATMFGGVDVVAACHRVDRGVAGDA